MLSAQSAPPQWRSALTDEESCYDKDNVRLSDVEVFEESREKWEEDI